MRLAVFCDFRYRRVGDEIYAEEPVALFLFALRAYGQRLVMVGRLDPGEKDYPYRVPSDVEFAALPHYERLSNPASALRASVGALRAYWRALEDVDAALLFGPHPLSIGFALLTRLRGRKLVLGVRQHLPGYARHRHPGRRGTLALAVVLEAAYRLIGRTCDVIVVGSELGRHYRRARRLLVMNISLVGEADIVDPESVTRSYDTEIRVLSVGRLDAEKNPLMLADVLECLAAGPGRWHLTVCGDGVMAPELARRLQAVEQLGPNARGELLGHVPAGPRLHDVYRSSHVFLHVSWTEGMPQVLLEAFAAALPLVATDVGGVADMAGGAAVLVAAGDPEAAAGAVRQLVNDSALRQELTAAGSSRLEGHTLEASASRVADFLNGAAVG